MKPKVIFDLQMIFTDDSCTRSLWRPVKLPFLLLNIPFEPNTHIYSGTVSHYTKFIEFGSEAYRFRIGLCGARNSTSRLWIVEMWPEYEGIKVLYRNLFVETTTDVWNRRNLHLSAVLLTLCVRQSASLYPLFYCGLSVSQNVHQLFKVFCVCSFSNDTITPQEPLVNVNFMLGWCKIQSPLKWEAHA